jgi:hypothetical protein
MDVAGYDNDEIDLLACSLESAGIDSPLVDVGWVQAWAEGAVSAEDIVDAATDAFGLE